MRFNHTQPENIAWQTEEESAAYLQMGETRHAKDDPGSGIPATVSIVGRQCGGRRQDAFEQRCERDMKPRLQVNSRVFGFQIDNTVSSRVLNNRSMHTYAGQQMLGMTALQSRTEVQIDAPSLADGGQECIAPRVSVELQFPRIEVFI